MTKPIKTFKTKQSSNFWTAYARQTISFQNALSELIDNAISARNKKAAGGLIPASVEITLQELEDKSVLVQVADDGCGVPLKALTNEDNIFNLGYVPDSKGHLNEHGFGLKNALALMTSCFQTEFSFFSRDINETGKTYRIDGPLQEDMSAYEDNDGWNEDLELLKDSNHGVKVRVRVKDVYFATIYTRSATFETNVKRLGEHLGVFYNHFLQGEQNSITIRYRSKDAGKWTSKKVPSIPVPFLKSEDTTVKTDTINVEYAGQTYTAQYTHGLLDGSVRNLDAETTFGWPYPLRIHYRGSNARCGVTVVVRDRVLKTGMFKEIWPDKAGNVSFNNFLAELRLGETFSTTNNKTDLDPHSEIVKLVLDRLAEDYEPEKDTKKQSEESLRKRIIKQIAAVHKLEGKNKPGHKKVWDGGAEIDVYYSVEKKNYVLETKIENAKVIDVYQLLMYWDGMIDEKKPMEQAVLVARSFSPSVQKAIAHVNALLDGDGNNYNIITQTIDQYSGD